MRQDQHVSEEGRAASALRFAVRLPWKLAAKVASRTIQVIFAVFVVILHPQLKWLFSLLADSALVRNYIKPSLRSFTVHVYEPYFAYLSSLPPYLATLSIALPLAILEPSKFFATILIAERPRVGIALWLALQGLSLVLIDRTWVAVRPQARKIRLVARVHAWGWLNMQYGKYWIRHSSLYRTAVRLKKQARRTVKSLWASLFSRRRRNLRT